MSARGVTRRPLLLEPPTVRVDPPRGSVQDAAGDERRKVLAEAMAGTLRKPVKDATGHRYRVAAVWLEELPERKR